jgi:hypothetical protein
VLSAGGTLTAAAQDWPAQRGIHQLAHWLGAAIQILAIALGSFLLSPLAGRRAALLFAGLYFFNAAIAWDFAFSRLDHEASFQFFLLFHLLGLAGLCRIDGGKRTYWALLAGISAGFCWWISATVMSALSVFITLGMAMECFRQREATHPTEMAKVILLWGGTAAGMIGLLSLLDGRFKLEPSIATIHPIFILAQLGSALFCLAFLLRSKSNKRIAFGISLALGLSPIFWLLAYREEAHPWLNPMMRRLHDYIVEFQSPFTNGLWNQSESLQAAAIAILALLTLRPLTKSRNGLFACLVVGLLLLAMLQTRWLGLLAATSALALCLQLKRGQMSPTFYLSLGLILLCMGTWAHKWTTIEDNPGRIFVTDLMLQVGARDINLNLQRLSQGETIHVAMPYAFAATSALFPEVHPIGTFYWENAKGIQASSDFFAGVESNTRIDYTVVQGGRQGAPFAKLINWVSQEDTSAETIENSPAWRLSTRQLPEAWSERPYFGTLGTDQFSVLIYESKESNPLRLGYLNR